jgi:Na+/proline symporter
LIGLGFLGSPQIFVRFIAIRSANELRAGTLVAIAWTFLADIGAVLTGLAGRALLTGADQTVTSVLGNNGEAVLPKLAEATLPPVVVGLIIAVVLSAIMSTADSLLIVAGSAAVRDYYQQVRHPELADDRLVGLSRLATFVLASAALVLAMTVALLNEQQTVFWFVIFGWSGIAATFCPTVMLSLYWRGMSRHGALAAMLVGFLGVPVFKFAAPMLPGDFGVFFAQLGELPPAFLSSFLAAIVVSRATQPPPNAAADLQFAALDDSDTRR